MLYAEKITRQDQKKKIRNWKCLNRSRTESATITHQVRRREESEVYIWITKSWLATAEGQAEHVTDHRGRTPSKGLDIRLPGHSNWRNE